MLLDVPRQARTRWLVLLLGSAVLACTGRGAPPTSEPSSSPEPTPTSPTTTEATTELDPGPLDPAALEAWATSTEHLDSMIHPEHGIFVLHNISGSMPHIDLVHRWPDGQESMIGQLLEQEEVLGQLRRARAWEAEYRPPGTEGECDPGSPSLDDGISPCGWVLDIHLGMREFDDEGNELVELAPPWITLPYEEVVRDSSLRDLASSHWDTEWTDHDWKRLQILDGATERAAYLEAVALYFGMIDGQWYLTGINGYDDACG